MPTQTAAPAVSPAVMAALKGEPTPTAVVEPADPEEIEDGIADDDDLELEAPEEEDEESAEDPEDGLPSNIKEILQKNRKELREVKAELAKAKKDLSKAQETNPDSEALAEGAAYKKLFMDSAAKASLAQAGATAGLDRLVKLIDFDSVDVESDGTINGLTDQIDALKEDFPELFSSKKAPKPTRVTAKGDAAPRPAPEPKKSSAQLIAGQLLGR